MYATGDYSILRLEATAADLGLTTRPTTRWPQSKPVSVSKLHKMLSDPYYAGWVVVDGQLVKGRHEPIISQRVFDRLQEVLAARSKGGSRDRVLSHYLKGMLFCERCHLQERTSRLVYTEARGRNGERYPYFLCRARQDGVCDLPHIPAAAVEEGVARNYATLELPSDFLNLVEAEVTAVIEDQQSLTKTLYDSYRVQLAKLDAREGRLIDLAADGVLSRKKIQDRQNQLVVERARLESSLASTDDQLQVGAQRLVEAMHRVRDVTGFYCDSADAAREQLNRTFFERFYVDDDPRVIACDDRRPPFDDLQDTFDAYGRYKTIAGLSGKPAHQRSRSGTQATPASRDQALALADIFSVGVSSRSVLVVLTGLRSKHFVALVNRLSALPLAPPAPPPAGPSRAFRFSSEQVATIIAEYIAGATMASLAKRYDVKRQSVAAVLQREGVAIRPRKVFSPSQIDEAVALYSTGLSAATIAGRFGFDTATIWRALKKSGVQMRSPNDWQH